MSRLLARLLVATPGVGHLIRWFADVPEPVYRDGDESLARILADVESLAGKGYANICVLAAAEAIEIERLLGRGFTYRSIEFEDGTLRWYGIYEPPTATGEVRLPLIRATTATQAGVASTN